jgi:hypothetical protein
LSRLSKAIGDFRGGFSDWRYLHSSESGLVPGIKPASRKIPVVVSLTTIAGRLPKVAVAIESLLRQETLPDRLILWLEEKLAGKIPAMLQKQVHRGLEIRLVADIGPHGKIIYALEEFPEAVIVTADDDVLYPPDWLGGLLDAHARAPDAITCHRAHRILTGENEKLLPYRQWDLLAAGHAEPSLWLFPTGVSGVLYPPGALPPEVLNRNVFQKICPKADDVWLKAMSLLNRTRCQKVGPVSKVWPAVRGMQDTTLLVHNVENGQNDVQLQAVFEHYDLYARLR